MKDGVLYVAARTGRRIVPIGVGASRAWILRSWDRFRVPRPFARICVKHGAPIAFATADGGTDNTDNTARATLGAAIGALTDECRHLAGAAS